MIFGTGLWASLEAKVAHRIDAFLHPEVARAYVAGPKGHVDLSPFLPPTFNQKRSSTCWAHSASACFYGAHAKAGKRLDAPPSPLYFAQCVYGQNGGPLLDRGAELQDAAKVFAELGEVPLQPPQQGGGTDVPETIDEQGNLIPLPAATNDELAKGKLACFDGEYSIRVDGNAPALIMASLDAGLFVWDGFSADRACEQLEANDVLGAPSGGSGHATLYYGYDLNKGRYWQVDGPVFFKRNSWGTGWARGGDFLVSSDHIRSSWALWPFAVKV